jgi:hypothetical protein
MGKLLRLPLSRFTQNDMKTKTTTTVLACLAAALVTAPGAFAAPKDIEEVIRALQNVPPPELPAKAAAVVNSAARENRSAVATTVLQVVSQTQPASAGAVRNALVSSGVIPAPKSPTAAAPVTPIGPRNDGTPNTPNEHSRFAIAPPHGGNPPGLNGQPGRHSPPPFVDYSKPRGF